MNEVNASEFSLRRLLQSTAMLELSATAQEASHVGLDHECGVGGCVRDPLNSQREHGNTKSPGGVPFGNNLPGSR
jgi:hypothetical protein